MALSTGMRRMLTEAGLWAGVGAIGVLAFAHLDRIASVAVPRLAALDRASATPLPPRRSSGVEIRADAHGHFIAPATVNGRSVDVMVDTGASLVALTYEDAQRAGIRVRPSDFTQRVTTANGHAKVAPIRLDAVAIGDVVVRDVGAVVAESGRLETTLLGMTFLSRLARVEISGGRLVLEE
jgi:aspartyl protease family protein